MFSIFLLCVCEPGPALLGSLKHWTRALNYRSESIPGMFVQPI